MGAYFKLGKLGYIYAFGGRGEDEQLLSSCEQYSIEESKDRINQCRKVERDQSHEEPSLDWLLHDLQTQNIRVWRLHWGSEEIEID